MYRGGSTSNRCKSKHMEPRAIQMFHAIGAAAILSLIVGCSPKQKPAESRFIEDIFVEGRCSEDHTTVSSRYEGEIVHWLKISNQAHSRYGFVNDFDSLSIENVSERMKDPNHYQPPFAIAFSNLSENDIAGSEFTLHGVSEHDDHGGGFNATCNLKVFGRLDHLPTDLERAEVLKHR
jgi:hypothetical protein